MTNNVAQETDWTRLATAIDTGILRYELKLIEVLLVLILKRETYGRQRRAAPVELDRWARELGIRADKLQRLYWRELISLGIVDVNEGQGTFRLRPEVEHWSRARGRRVPERAQGEAGAQELPLQLVAERPLSDALSDLATESAMRSGTEGPGREPQRGAKGTESRGAGCDQPTPGFGPASWEGLRRSLDGPADNFAGTAADKSAAGAAKFATAVADKSAALQVADTGPPAELFTVFTDPYSLAKLQLIKAEAKLSCTAADKSAALRGAGCVGGDRSAAAMAWLRQVDRNGRLKRGDVLAQWSDLCERDPGYVLGWLRKRFEDPHDPLRNPLGWLAKVAIEDRKLKPIGRGIAKRR